jgi:hypothetical protein
MNKLRAKQPYEEYYVSFDFSDVLGSASVATADIIVYDSTGATCTSSIVDLANTSLATTSVNVWVKGGVADQGYKITCRIEGNSIPSEKYELDALLPVVEV